jgi:hypothetical protein
MGEQNEIHPVTVNASDLVFSLSDFALDYGINSIRGTKGPLIPFVVTVVNGEKFLTRYAADNVADGVEAAKNSIASLPPDVQAYAIAYDAFIYLQNQKFDAIVVEVGERGQEQAYQFAQRYKPKAFLRSFSTIGNPMFLGKIPQRLK